MNNKFILSNILQFLSVYRQTLANPLLSVLLNKTVRQMKDRQTNGLDYIILFFGMIVIFIKNILMLLNYSKLINPDITVYLKNKYCINYEVILV
jgi:hypothetical protein